MVQEFDQLAARSQAAIAEARRLVELNLQWQRQIAENIDRMFLATRFEPVGQKPVFPQDFPERRPSSLHRSQGLALKRDKSVGFTGS